MKTSTVNGEKATRCPVLTPKEVDGAVNDVFTAFTTDLGRPFKAGNKNVRSITRTWCPLLQDTEGMDPPSFKRNYVSAHFFDRYFYSSERDVQRKLESRAFEKFLDGLLLGERMNEKLRTHSFSDKLNTILCSASLEIARILGDFDQDKWFEYVAHGPNATLGVSKLEAYHHNKVISLDGTLPALRTFQDYVEWNSPLSYYLIRQIGQKRVKLEAVEGNRLSFVPKKFDSLRTMSVEATVNQALQQGLGSYMAECLRSTGIDLETQSHCHRSLVRFVSTGRMEIATLDWSSASDRIWLELGHALLPSDWFAAICDVRSPVTTYKGQTYDLAMVGSMGNGVTFPLQTLLFLTLLRALARESDIVHQPLGQFITVFGDDCICDSSLLPEVEWLAEELGWSLNRDKSFFSGEFRESCGEDNFRGMSCRPFKIQRPIDVYTPSGLMSWAYGVYNLCSAAMRDVGRPYHVGLWLAAFAERVGVRTLFYVPPRFSESSGVRVKDPAIIEPIPGYPTQIKGNAAFGWEFPFLGTQKITVPCDQEPYYLLALEGKGVPKSFSKAQMCQEEDGAYRGLCPQGAVPWKGVHYRKTKGSCLTWSYFIE